MTLRKGGIALCLLLFPLGVGAYDLGQVLSHLQEKEKTIKRVKFDFSQTIVFHGMQEKTVVQGKAIFAKPNRLRISKDQPQTQLTISDGKKVWVYTPDYNQVWMGRWKDWVHSQILPHGMIPIQGYVSSLISNFDLSLIEKTGEPEPAHVLIQALPKDSNLGYSLQLFVSTGSWLPAKTLYQSESAQVTTTLSQLRLNPDVTGELFQFSPPPGVDVIPLD